MIDTDKTHPVASMAQGRTIEAVKAAIENVPYPYVAGEWDEELGEEKPYTLREFYERTWQGANADSLFDAVARAAVSAFYAPASAVEALREALEEVKRINCQQEIGALYPDDREGWESAFDDAYEIAATALTAQAHPAGDDPVGLKDDRCLRCYTASPASFAHLCHIPECEHRKETALATHPRPDEAQGQSGEAIAMIGKDWRLLWANQDTLSAIVNRTGLKIGDKLYAHPAPASDAGEIIRKAAHKALGEWLAWPDAARDGPVPVDDSKVLSWLSGLPQKLAALSTTGTSQGQGERG